MDIITCLQLYWAFLKVGLFTIGGGYAMIPLINREVAANWPQLAGAMQDLIGISQITPGAFALNAATFAGMMAGGVFGSIFATLGVITPSLVITTVVARFFYQIRGKRAVKDVFYGMRPAVLGLIAGTVVTMMPEQYLATDGLSINIRAIFITIIALYAMLKLRINPIVMIVVSAVLGILLFAL